MNEQILLDALRMNADSLCCGLVAMALIIGAYFVMWAICKRCADIDQIEEDRTNERRS